MDFTSPPAVIDGFRRIVEHGTFGYTRCFDEFYDAVIAFQRKRHQVEVEKVVDHVDLRHRIHAALHGSGILQTG